MEEPTKSLHPQWLRPMQGTRPKKRRRRKRRKRRASCCEPQIKVLFDCPGIQHLNCINFSFLPVLLLSHNVHAGSLLQLSLPNITFHIVFISVSHFLCIPTCGANGWHPKLVQGAFQLSSPTCCELTQLSAKPKSLFSRQLPVLPYLKINLSMHVTSSRYFLHK